MGQVVVWDIDLYYINLYDYISNGEAITIWTCQALIKKRGKKYCKKLSQRTDSTDGAHHIEEKACF